MCAHASGGLRCQQRCGVRDALLHACEQVAARCVPGALERVPKRERIGAAVALEHQPAQPKQRRAVVAAVVHAALEGGQHGLAGERCQLGERRARELLAHELREHGRQPLNGFQRHIAHETVAYHDVDVTAENVVAFNIADEVQKQING